MQNEFEIDALLSVSETGSIIDRLLALPRQEDVSQNAGEWDRAVSSRLEIHLARRMRSLIDGENSRPNAA